MAAGCPRLPSSRFVFLLVPAVCASAMAQEPAQGSRNLPLGHWAYEYIGRLRDRGYLANLNPLVQPYRRLEVAKGLSVLDPDTLNRAVREWVSLLRDELAPELLRLARGSGGKVGVELAVGGRVSTSQRLDPLRPLGEEDAWPRFSAAGWLETGPLAAESRLAGDVYLTYDPDGVDPGQRRGGRTDNAYVSATFPFGGITVGRLKRNWSAIGTNGLMVSDVATPYPQLEFEAAVGRLTLRSFTGELETLGSSKRYLAAHRLDYQSRDFVASFGESFLYVPGEGQLALRYLNPLEFFFFDADNQPTDHAVNLLLDAQVWYRRGVTAFYFEWMLDDIDVIPGARDPEPLLYAFRVGSRVSPRAGWFNLSLEYQQVAAFAYRTPNVVDRYSFLGRGLGENYSDFDRLTLAADLFPRVRGLRISPTLALQRQGEGNFRDSVPPMAEYLASPTIFLGTAERTFRLGVRGRYQPNRYVWVSWDVGENFVENVGHVVDMSERRFAAVVELGAAVPLGRRN